MENISGRVYLTINTVTGSKYVGQTSKNKKNYLGSGLILKQAIKKYGISNFIQLTLKHCNSQKELNYYEIKYISDFNAVKRDDYYNLAYGGAGSNGNKGKIGILNPRFGIPMLESTKEKLRFLAKNRKRIPHRQETKDKIRISNLGRNNDFAISKCIEATQKEVYQYDKNLNLIRKWKSAAEASKYLKLDRATISKCCLQTKKHKLKNGKSTYYTIRKVGGFIWKFK